MKIFDIKFSIEGDDMQKIDGGLMQYLRILFMICLQVYFKNIFVF